MLQATALFKTSVPYTEKQFAQAFNFYKDNENTVFSINGNILTINTFSVLNNGYFLTFTGTQDFTIPAGEFFLEAVYDKTSNLTTLQLVPNEGTTTTDVFYKTIGKISNINGNITASTLEKYSFLTWDGLNVEQGAYSTLQDGGTYIDIKNNADELQSRFQIGKNTLVFTDSSGVVYDLLDLTGGTGDSIQTWINQIIANRYNIQLLGGTFSNFIVNLNNLTPSEVTGNNYYIEINANLNAFSQNRNARLNATRDSITFTGSDGTGVSQYALNTPDNVNTVGVSLGAKSDTSGKFEFSNDGTLFIEASPFSGANLITSREMTTPFRVSTINNATQVSHVTPNHSHEEIMLSPDGTKFFSLYQIKDNGTTDPLRVGIFSMTTPLDITTINDNPLTTINIPNFIKEKSRIIYYNATRDLVAVQNYDTTQIIYFNIDFSTNSITQIPSNSKCNGFWYSLETNTVASNTSSTTNFVKYNGLSIGNIVETTVDNPTGGDLTTVTIECDIGVIPTLEMDGSGGLDGYETVTQTASSVSNNKQIISYYYINEGLIANTTKIRVNIPSETTQFRILGGTT